MDWIQTRFSMVAAGLLILLLASGTAWAADAPEPAFLMPVEDVFMITGRGTVVVGRIERGEIHVGDTVEVVGLGETRTTTVTGVEMFRTLLDSAEAGDNVGLLLSGVEKSDVKRGQVIALPQSVKPYTRFSAEITLTEGEGAAAPFVTGYQPQFRVRTAEVAGTITLPKRTKRVMPGDTVTVDVELAEPIALEGGLSFAIREDGKASGSGRVASVVD